ncbi:MAG TPA: hypothetical protein PK771_15675 [Spirochaetota bacterium]|nr:hypothetical protein [Spirochaetota bacterium]
MSKVVIIIGVVVAIITVAILIFLAVNGFFYNPTASEKIMGPYAYAYEDFVGPYSKTFPVFDRVYKTLSGANIENTVGIGLYYDDPAKIPANQLRSSCGSIIKEDEIEKAQSLGLKTGKIESKLSVVVEFPVKSMMAYMFAPSKCYPVLTKYLQEKGYQMAAPFEIYDMPNKKMYVVMEIIK